MIFFATEGKAFILFIHHDVAAAGYAAFAHTTGHNRCMGCHAASDGQNTLSCFHTFDIFRRCFKTDKHNLLTALCPFFGIIGRKYNLTAGSTRRSTQCLADWNCLFQNILIKLRMQ